MKVAAWQAPLSAVGSMAVLGLIRARVEECEAEGIADPDGKVVQAARRFGEALVVAEIRATAPARCRGWDASRNRAVMEAYAAHVAASADAARDSQISREGALSS